MHVLVTGAAGFIGSHVTEALLARGDTVVGVDNFNTFYDPAIKASNVHEIEARSRPGAFRLLRADIVRDVSVIEAELDRERPDVIVHLAAMAGVRPSILDPLLYQRVNVEGTNLLLELSRKRGIKPFVFASSSSVYGARTEVPFREEDRVDDPVSPYAATKKAGELIGYTYHHLFGTRFVGLRFFTVYGPRQRPEMAIHLFARRILAGQPITLYGDGSSSRDYTFIDDIVSGVLRSIDRAASVDGYRIYNLGKSDTTTLSELVERIEQALGKKAIIDRRPDQPGDVPRTFASVDRAVSELGYAPTTPVSVGIPRFIEWLLRQAK
ncbi:MAG: NAD-dependent epimerase/dehydratase family protein [Deltaproteobacteria bacterium]|nr:NAD-dependent epimerase/dehydratase family protein [Deltaproteobacteria bacterium]